MFEIGMHWCSRCKAFKPADEFGNASAKKYGKISFCKKCASKRVRGRSREVREQYIAKAKEYQERKRRAALKEAGAYCQRCGYSEFSSGLAFHHVNPEEKENSTPLASLGMKRFMREVDKCVVLCSNCHHALHAGEWSGEFEKSDGLGWRIVETT
jgi:5-methylcytosine-specific restriction endonuclease McrA